jgi:hypothetical protein
MSKKLAKTAADHLDEGAETFRERNALYGQNYKNFGTVMRGMFPEGITLKTEDDFNRFHLMLLTAVKITRYANMFSRGGHVDSSHDMMVYSAMLEEVTLEGLEARKHNLRKGKRR